MAELLLALVARLLVHGWLPLVVLLLRDMLDIFVQSNLSNIGVLQTRNVWVLRRGDLSAVMVLPISNLLLDDA